MICEHKCELIQDCRIFDKKIFFDASTKDIISWAFGRGHRYYLRLDGKLYILIDDDNNKMYLRNDELSVDELNDIIMYKLNEHFII